METWNMSETGKVKIHGREYLTVALRVQTFREDHRDWCIATEVIHRDDEVVLLKASIFDEAGVLKATGHSEEKRAASQINRTSALENAETSAIGRALAALGYVGTEFASADEVANAIRQQGIHKPSDGAMESLEADQQTVVKDTAEEVKVLMAGGKIVQAFDWLEAANFDAEAKIAAWALLPSHYRAALKKEGDGRKAIRALKEMKNDVP
jgi:hypothetical protein